MNYNRYKDREPKETISLAKELLKYFNLSYEDDISFNPLENIYSCHIKIPSLLLSVNGKGTTQEYCYASGYGELLEKLLNVYFRFFYVNESKTMQQMYDSQSFYIDRDIQALPDGLLEDMKVSFYESDGRMPTIEELIEVYQTKFGSNVINSIPFYSVKSDDTINLPKEIIDCLMWSNGISCGNTLEEAISQAIFEIFERYVYGEILINKLTPPIIPIDYILKHCSHLSNIIKSFSDIYDVRFYDCSLGCNFPVVAIMLIDKNTQSYKLNFGSHVSFNIAVERCMTEVLQGYKDFATVNCGMTQFNLKDDVFTSNNFYMRFRRNVGNIPVNFFSNESSWEFNGWMYEKEYISNKDIVRDLINFCLNYNTDVYIRNNTCFGFSGVRVYIPRLSYIKLADPKGLLTKYSTEQMLTLEGFYYNEISSIDDYKRLFEFDLGRINYFSRLPKELLLAASYFDIGCINECVNTLNLISDKFLYVKVLSHTIQLLQRKLSKEDINTILRTFYNDNDIQFSYMLLNGSLLKNVLKYRSKPPYSREEYEEVESNIKKYITLYIEYMTNNPINQKDTCKIFYK